MDTFMQGIADILTVLTYIFMALLMAVIYLFVTVAPIILAVWIILKMIGVL